MLNLIFNKPKQASLNILCLGAHSDDIEIGCGGTIIRLAKENPDLFITWVVFSAIGERAVEAQHSADEFLKDVRRKQIFLLT